MLLQDIVEGELDHDLTEGWILLCLFNRDRRPNHIYDLGWITLFVRLFTDVTE